MSEDLSPPSPEEPWVEVRRCPQLAEARALALPLAARELPYEVARAQRAWAVRVPEALAAVAETELAAFEAEQRESARERAVPDPLLTQPFPLVSLLTAAALLTGCFLLQRVFGRGIVDAGAADAARILQGEWWRCFTALTLHADSGHLVANLGSGLLFGAFLVPLLGSGVSALLVLVAGALGNLANSWGYRTEAHFSLGASTAVFAALGLLVGVELAARWGARRHRRGWWHLMAPVAGGLALLAYLGVGEPNSRIDFMAHAWGLVAGTVLGAPYGLLRGERALRWPWQAAAGLVAAALVAMAWSAAWAHR